MKKLFLVLAVALTGFTAVSAEGDESRLGIGVSGALYIQGSVDTIDIAKVFNDFKNGNGIFYGLYGEFGTDIYMVGVAANVSFYDEDWSYFGFGGYKVKMMDMDQNVYFQLHPFQVTAIFDPFVEAGLGLMSKDYALKEFDPDPSNPLLSSLYADLGLGLNINIGPIGIMLKGLYNIPIANKISGDIIDENGNNLGSYDISKYPLKSIKILLGAKFNF